MRIIIGLLIFIVTLAVCDKPSLKADINNVMLTTLKDALMKDISKHLKEIPLPDFEQNLLIAVVKATNITMHVMPFNASQIEIELRGNVPGLKKYRPQPKHRELMQLLRKFQNEDLKQVLEYL